LTPHHSRAFPPSDLISSLLLISSSFQSLHPHFHPSSPARCVDLTVATSRKIQGPKALSCGIAQGNWAQPYDEATWEETRKKKVVYSKEDDKAIEQWVRDHTETTWHSLGTCAMAPRDKVSFLFTLSTTRVVHCKIADLLQL